jgi:xanthosine utilization system XapX-like protein
MDDNRHGPGRGELWFRLAFSLAGLVLVVVAGTVHGLPSGPALVEVFGIAGMFFGATAAWSAWRLFKRKQAGHAARPDADG